MTAHLKEYRFDLFQEKKILVTAPLGVLPITQPAGPEPVTGQAACRDITSESICSARTRECIWKEGQCWIYPFDPSYCRDRSCAEGEGGCKSTANCGSELTCIDPGNRHMLCCLPDRADRCRSNFENFIAKQKG